MVPLATPSSSAWVSVLAFSTHTRSGSVSRAAYRVFAWELPAAISRSALPISASEFGPRGAAAIDQMLRHPLIRRAELDAGYVLRRGPSIRRPPAGHGRWSMPRRFLHRCARGDFELDANSSAKRRASSYSGPSGHVARPAIIGERAVARDHAQFAQGLDLIDQTRQRRAGAQQRDGRHRDDDLRPALPIDMRIQVYARS